MNCLLLRTVLVSFVLQNNPVIHTMLPLEQEVVIEMKSLPLGASYSANMSNHFLVPQLL